MKYEYPPETQKKLDEFFGELDRFSTSSEMITTWLGQNPQHGGMVVLPWNLLARMVHQLVQDQHQD
jgi:hypothetical protein